MKCLKCGGTEMAVIQETNGFSMSGILAAFLFIFGLIVLLFNPLIGLITIIIAILIGIFGRGKSNYMLCLSCRNKIKI